MPGQMDSAEVVDHVRAFLDCGLMLDPWLGDLAERRIEPGAERLLRHVAAEMTLRFGGTGQAGGAVGVHAALDTLASTAAVIAHDRVGRIAVTGSMAEEARRRLMAFIGRRGFRALVWVHGAISRFEHLGVMRYYGRTAEREFVAGARRRPWFDAPLDVELTRGLADGDFRVDGPGGARWVEATAQGVRRYEEIHGVLAQAGFLEARLRLALVSELNLIPDYDATRRRMLPREVEWRRHLTAFVGIPRGARVVEVGSATGLQIFEGGLLDAVGPGGDITGVCPSVVLTDQARAKAQRRQAGNVRFVRSHFEALPFPDGRFDVAIGVAMLQRTDPARAVAEMARVTRPGGLVAHGTSCTPGDPPRWLLDWLAPVLARAGAPGGGRPHARPRPGQVAQWFEAAGLVDVRTAAQFSQSVFDDPDAVALLLLRTDPVIQQALGGLPWSAAQDLIAELTERAHSILPRLTPEEQRVMIPVESVVGRVPGAGREPEAGRELGAGRVAPGA